MFGKFLAACAILALCTVPARAAQVIIVNGDGPGVGFNDPTSATPVGGNPGTTKGDQALFVFQQAADLWGKTLVSDQPILVLAFFTPLSCSATSGVLGAAGAYWYFANVPGAGGGKALPVNTWHPAALAEKITRQDIVADPNQPFEIFAVFNNQLGTPACLSASGWYYGLDNNNPANRIDLLAVVLHEFGHGLGFAAGPTNASTGVRANGWPSVWERQMLDTTTGKRWIDMTTAERAASARNNLNLVWAGRNASNVVPSVLDFRAEVAVLDPEALGVGEAVPASFGSPLDMHTRGTLVAPSPVDGCAPFPGGAGIAGNIVLVDRGTCAFVQKALNAQNAGATGLVVANNTAGLLSMGGVDPSIVIPVVGVTQSFGASLRSVLLPYLDLRRNPRVRAGTVGNYPRLYAPASFASGSSVSHWDTSATPSLLMEPFITSELTSSVKNPEDLTRGLLRDIGW